MIHLRGYISLIVLLVVIGIAPAADRQDSGTAQTTKLDVYGDPLPSGAIARIGSIRLRHAGLSDLVNLPDGKTILSAGSDRVLRWWDQPTGKPLRTVKLQGEGGPGYCQTLSPNGKWLVAQDAQNLVFWEVATGKEVKRLPLGNQNSVSYLYFSPDGKTLAASVAGVETLWQWAEGRQQVVNEPRVQRQNGALMRLNSSQHGCFSHDGKMFASGYSMQVLTLWEVATGKEIRRIDCSPTIWIFSPDDKFIAAACSKVGAAGGGPISYRLFEVATGKELIQKEGPQSGYFWWVDVSSDSKSIAFVDQQNIYVLERETLKERLRIPAGVRMVFFSADNKWLMGNHGNRIRIWDASTGKEVPSFPGLIYGPNAVALSPDGRKVATGSYAWRDPVVLWDSATGRLIHGFDFKDIDGIVSGLGFSSDNKYLLEGTTSGQVLFWDADSAKLLRTLQLKDPSNPNSRNYQRIHLSSDGKQICTYEQIWGPMGQSSQMASWDPTSGKVVKQVPLPLGQEPILSPNGKSAAYLGQDGVTVLDMTMGQTLAHIPGQWMGNLAISPDGTLLAARNQQAATNGPSIVIWETVSGKPVAELAAGPAHSWALAGDNRTVITMDVKSIRVWDLATRREKHQVPLSKTSSSINPNQIGMRATAHLTPDGRRLLTPESDGTLLIWDLSPAFPSQISESKNIELERIASWWADLAQADPAVAYAAVWSLTDAPADAVALFQKQMKPAVDADFEKVRKLVKELDDDRFEVRQTASRELEKMGALIQPALRHFLEVQPPPEVRRRLEALVQNSGGVNQSPELLRQLRAIGVLERIGSKDARQLLATLATGVPYAPETLAAKSALERLAAR